MPVLVLYWVTLVRNRYAELTRPVAAMWMCLMNIDCCNVNNKHSCLHKTHPKLALYDIFQ